MFFTPDVVEAARRSTDASWLENLVKQMIPCAEQSELAIVIAENPHTTDIAREELLYMNWTDIDVFLTIIDNMMLENTDSVQDLDWSDLKAVSNALSDEQMLKVGEKCLFARLISFIQENRYDWNEREWLDVQSAMCSLVGRSRCRDDSDIGLKSFKGLKYPSSENDEYDEDEEDFYDMMRYQEEHPDEDDAIC